MARRKTETITSLGSNEDKLTVQKSLPLFSLWRSDMTLAEFKILDTYLSRIDSHKPDRRTVKFEKGELEELLGVAKINNLDLGMRLKHLMGNVIEVADDSAKRGFKLVTLFEEAVAEQDEYGVWQVKFECTQKAMKYFFNIENLGYLRYKLRCITSLTSRYTYIMFIYLESNRYRKSWNIPLDKLKQILNCDGEDTYKEFKFFNNKILKKVQKEIHEKTECRYEYETIKKGRSVVAIKFTLETLKELEEDSELDEVEQTDELWQESLKSFGFSAEQYDEIFSILVTVPETKLPHNETSEYSPEIARYHYLDRKAKEIIRRDKKTPIRDKYAYLIKMMTQDAAT